jgi:hypothetical protein
MRWAFIAGLVGGGFVTGFLAFQKGRELAGRGKALAQSLADGGSDLEAYLASQGTSLAAELERIAREEVTRSATQTAEEYMGTVYGLTPERIARIGALGSAFERLT